MPTQHPRWSQLLLRSALFSFVLLTANIARADDSKSAGPLPMLEDRPLSVAAIITEYRPWSHADVIIGRFIQGLTYDLSSHWASIKVRAMYLDQIPPTDLSKPMGLAYNVRIASTIRDAILDEDGNLAVGAVLLIGEHGQYPYNDREQHLYPRRRFFEETVAAFREAGAVVPIFNDKHLAARWDDGKYMYETAKQMGIPFMAGSSLPLAWRRPWLEVPLGAAMDEAVGVGYGGLEAYGFHALEALQCMVERRSGGEAGVAAVQCLEGESVWKAMDAGRFSQTVLEAALARNTPPAHTNYRERCPNPTAYFIEYADGFRATCLMLNGAANQFLAAVQLTGDARPAGTQFWLQEPLFGHFSYLSGAIQQMVRTGKPSYPVERTVLTTGILSTAMDSRHEGHRRIETPDLVIPYTPIDHALGAYRHPEAANARDGGWIQLFNGRDLDGWRENRYRHDPAWTVENGVLTGRGGQGYLATYDEFEDFELFAEVRISDTGGRRGNSGIYFHCQLHEDRTKEFPPGYEAQCDHGDRNNPTGSIYNLKEEGARAPGRPPKDGEWFTMRVRVEGNHFRTWVNGAPGADCRDSRKAFRRGYILLQMHHKTGVVEYREVRIRRLPPSGAPR